MAESLLEGKEERNDLNKLKMKKEFFEKVEDFVRKSTFFSKMLKFNGEQTELFNQGECCVGGNIRVVTWFVSDQYF